MTIVDVTQELLAELSGRGPLTVTSLSVLDPIPEPYEALLLQPAGTVFADLTRIGNVDSAAALPMYRSFLERAAERQVQLAVTPEYSTPWAALEDVLFGTTRPAMGALWALGCESITVAELETFADRVNGTDGLQLIHEPVDPQQRAQKAFIDPLVYVFWAKNAANQDVLCVLVQFKTVASRDEDHVELNRLYLGRSVYRFSGTGGVSLLGLLCSDAFAFRGTLPDAQLQNLLILHVQLNPRPGHPDYADYRRHLFAVASNNQVEVLCLNWSNRSIVDGAPSPFIETSGSAWYVAPRCLEVRDTQVSRLHREGVYYSIVGERWHGFYLNFGAHALLVQKQRVYIAGVQIVAPRLPMQVVERTAWSAEGAAWVADIADDGFTSFIQAYAPLSPDLPELCRRDPLAVERALELLAGAEGSVKQWYALKELVTLKVAEEESIRRITVSQETNTSRPGVAFRSERTRRARTAIGIPSEAPSWPPAVADLAEGFRFEWLPSSPHDNVITPSGSSAALVYLGENPEEHILETVYAKVRRIRRQHAADEAVKADTDPKEALARAEDRLCVAYRKGTQIQFHRSPLHASITAPAEGLSDEITGDGD